VDEVQNVPGNVGVVTDAGHRHEKQHGEAEVGAGANKSENEAKGKTKKSDLSQLVFSTLIVTIVAMLFTALIPGLPLLSAALGCGVGALGAKAITPDEPKAKLTTVDTHKEKKETVCDINNVQPQIKIISEALKDSGVSVGGSNSSSQNSLQSPIHKQRSSVAQNWP
jgi:flagellar biosynthesis component FlhA